MAVVTDCTGRENDDDLSLFLQWWWADGRPRAINVPADNPLSFSAQADGVVGVTLFRQAEFQAQLFTFPPDHNIRVHIHPNVASYEIGLFGINLSRNGKRINSGDGSEPVGVSTPWQVPGAVVQKKILRLDPDDAHGGRTSPMGASFISVQQWLNGVPPTNVSDDWDDTPWRMASILHKHNPAPRVYG